VSAQQLLADLQEKGFALAVEGNGIRVTPATRLTPELRQAIRAAKAQLLALLPPPSAPDRTTPVPSVAAVPTIPWNGAHADALIAGLQQRRQLLYGPSRWPPDPATRRRLGQWMDWVDAVFVARDLPALRRLAAEFPAEPSPAVAPTAEDAALRIIERDMDLPRGSLMFHPPLHSCPGCTFCRWPADGPPAGPGEDLGAVWSRIINRSKKGSPRAAAEGQQGQNPADGPPG
jgi:hypothetical protein